MISIGRLSNAATAADYYLNRQADCSLDYYTGDGERRGVWLGRGAAALGLSGEFSRSDEEVFRQLLHGRDADGAALVRPEWRTDPRALVHARPLVAAIRAAVPDLSVVADPGVRAELASLTGRVDRAGHVAVQVRADIAVRLADAAGVDARAVYSGAGTSLDTALARVGERVDVRRPGYDVVFSAPKSVSVAYGLASPEVANTIREAHTTAITESLRYLEMFVARGARGKHQQGLHATRVGTDGLVAAAFEHRASRADDPQLHTHVVFANVVHGADGKWSALDSAALYRHQLTAGYLYQAVLRGELTRTLGAEWTGVRKGVAEITGIPPSVCRVFSQRRQAIEARLAERGESGMDAARAAALDTRPAKPHTDPVTLRERWQARALDAGFDTATLPLPGPSMGPDIDDRAVVTAVTSPTGLTEQRSTFAPRDVLRAVCEALPVGAQVDLDRLLDLGRQVVRDPDTVPLLHPAGPGERSYTTTELLTAEATALALVARQHDAGLALVPAPVVEAALARDVLVAEQAEVVRQLTTSGVGVQVLVGPAGAGKTRTLHAARRAWEAAGHPVVGASLAAVAARQLQAGSGIRSSSLSRFLADVKQQGLPREAVLVLDEASMIGTRQLLEVLQFAEQARAKVVLVGDPHQLSEIDAGGLFAALAEQDTALRLTTNQRQQQVWERNALTALRDGDPHTALDAYAAHDRIRITHTRTELLERICADYLLAHRPCPPTPRDATDVAAGDGNSGRDVLVLAVRNAEVRAVNEAIRGYLRTHRLLGEQEVTVGVGDRARQFAAGDRVVVTRNDYSREVFNGTRARVTAVDPTAGTLRLTTTDGLEVTVDAAWAAERLEHGYAMTCHRAQGVTVDVALLYGTAALTREAAYVAMSRGRIANYVYATHDHLRELDVADGCGLDQPDPTRSSPAVSEREVLIGAVERSHRQRLAHEHHPLSRLPLDPALDAGAVSPARQIS